MNLHWTEIYKTLTYRNVHYYYLQNVLLRQEQQLNDSLGSELSYVSSGGDNLVWIEEDLGNNCLMVR